MRFILITTLLLLSHVAHSDPLVAGSKSLGLKLGTANISTESYTVAGASINYFAIDNLSIGGAYEYWFSSGPDVSKITFESTYYVPTSDHIKPYLGLLYSRYFVEQVDDDIDAYGYRMGVAYIQSPLLFSAGIRQEKYTSDDVIFADDDATVEFIVGLSF